MADPPASNNNNGGIAGRVRTASLSVINANPQLGMWQATGTAIAQAPNLSELRDTDSGGDNIVFTPQGHSARIAVQEPDGDLSLIRSATGTAGSPSPAARPTFTNVFETKPDEVRRGHAETDETRILMGDMQRDNSASLPDESQQFRRRQSLHEKHMAKEKAPWKVTVMNGLKAFWKWFLTPMGFIITIYALNVVAWGAMLFFLIINAAPAMNYPTADDINSPKKKWLEICSQILNALFCVTGFGLAPWRFRDLYYYIRAVHFKNLAAMRKLSEQNKGWFRPPAWSYENGEGEGAIKRTPTFTDKRAPPTSLWKLGFTIYMMVINTILQAVLSYFMWAYNRIDRPGWSTGTFMALGMVSAMLAGLMSWWEGRKVKKIEGPEVKVVQEV